MSKELIRLRDCVMSYGDEVVLDHIDRADTGRFSKPLRFTVSSISITRLWISCSGIFILCPPTPWW